VTDYIPTSLGKGHHPDVMNTERKVMAMPRATDADRVSAAKVLAGLASSEGLTPSELKETFAMFGIEKHHAVQALEEIRLEESR
jgi:hypothetical protein